MSLLNQNPIKIDATMATSYKSQVATTLGTLFTLQIEKVYWFDPTTVGDQVNIVDPGTGNPLLPMRCETAGQSQLVDWSAHPKLWRDFRVAQLDSGYLWIYTR